MDSRLTPELVERPMLLLPYDLWRGFTTEPQRTCVLASIAHPTAPQIKKLVNLACDQRTVAVPCFDEAPDSPAVLLTAWLEDLERQAARDVARRNDRRAA
jgi:hypothetical protein